MRGNNMMRVDKLICLLCISEREREKERFGKFKYLLNIIESRRHKDVPVFIYMVFFSLSDSCKELFALKKHF